MLFINLQAKYFTKTDYRGRFTLQTHEAFKFTKSDIL